MEQLTTEQIAEKLKYIALMMPFNSELNDGKEAVCLVYTGAGYLYLRQNGTVLSLGDPKLGFYSYTDDDVIIDVEAVDFYLNTLQYGLRNIIDYYGNISGVDVKTFYLSFKHFIENTAKKVFYSIRLDHGIDHQRENKLSHEDIIFEYKSLHRITHKGYKVIYNKRYIADLVIGNDYSVNLDCIHLDNIRFSGLFNAYNLHSYNEEPISFSAFEAEYNKAKELKAKEEQEKADQLLLDSFKAKILAFWSKFDNKQLDLNKVDDECFIACLTNPTIFLAGKEVGYIDEVYDYNPEVSLRLPNYVLNYLKAKQQEAIELEAEKNKDLDLIKQLTEELNSLKAKLTLDQIYKEYLSTVGSYSGSKLTIHNTGSIYCRIKRHNLSMNLELGYYDEETDEIEDFSFKAKLLSAVESIKQTNNS